LISNDPNNDKPIYLISFKTANKNINDVKNKRLFLRMYKLNKQILGDLQ